MKKVIIISRRPLENIKSILDRLNLPGDLESDKQLPEFNKHWNVMLLQGKGINYLERLAYKWIEVSKALSVLEKSHSVYRIKYEDFNFDKQKTIDDVVDFIGWNKINEITEFLNKAYQPKSRNTHISLNSFYGNNFDRLTNIFENQV